MREKTSSDFDGKDKKYRLTSILTIKIVNFVVNDKKKVSLWYSFIFKLYEVFRFKVDFLFLDHFWVV
jgi:hypothetical protein